MRLLLLLAALALLACAWASAAPSITFDSEQYITVIFRYYSSNNSYSSNLAGLSSFKLFADNARPGDMIYFGYGWWGVVSAKPWHDLFLNITSPLAGTGIRLVWEYYNGSAKAWVPIPNLVDETDQLTKPGWVRFPIPPHWYYHTGAAGFPAFDGLRINGVGSLWIRVRLVNGTVTSGGYVGSRVKCRNWTLTVRDFPSLNFSYLYQVAKQWGIAYSPMPGVYLFAANIQLLNVTLYSQKEIVQIGTPDRPMTIEADGKTSLYFGRLVGGAGVDGSEIYLHTRYTYPFLPLGNFYFYGSRFTRFGGTVGSPYLPFNVSIVDSQFIMDSPLFFWDAKGEITRLLYSVDNWFYLYTGGVVINSVVLPPTAYGIRVGRLSDGLIMNVYFYPTQQLSRWHGARVDLLDCTIRPSQIVSEYPTLNNPSRRDVWVRILYSFNLKLVDKDGNPVSGATVKLYDRDGNLVFSLVTNSTGQIPTQKVLTYWTWWNASENYSIRHEKYYTPHTLVVSHPDYPPIVMTVSIWQRTDLLLPMDPLDPAELHVNTTRNLYLPRDVVIINAYVLYENARQTGLTINVTVFKPDGSKSPLIQLRDDGVWPDQAANDGVYTGLFTDTSMPGVYRVNASTIFQSAVLRANWTFLVDNTADLVLRINASLSSQLSKVNSTLHARIDAVNKSLSAQVASVNNTIKTCCSEVKDLVRAVNSTLYNKMVSVNGSIAGKLASVNQSLYAVIMAVNGSIHVRLSNINVDTTSLENLVKSVNQTLYGKLDRVNATLYGKLVQINDTLYLKVVGLELELAGANATLHSAIRSANSTLYAELLAVNQSLHLKLSSVKCDTSQLEDAVKSVNATLHGRLASINNTLYLKVDAIQLRLLQVNSTLHDAIIRSNGSIHVKLGAIDAKTSSVLARLGEVNASLHGTIVAVGDKLYVKVSAVESQVAGQSAALSQAAQSLSQVSDAVQRVAQQVPEKVDRSTSAILSELERLRAEVSRVREEVARLREELSRAQAVSVLQWALLLAVPALLLAAVALRRAPAPRGPPPGRLKVVRAVIGALVVVAAWLLLPRLGGALPIPAHVALILVAIGVLVSLLVGAKYGLALAALLGLVYYLLRSGVPVPELPLPPLGPSLPVVAAAALLAVAYLIVRRLARRRAGRALEIG